MSEMKTKEIRLKTGGWSDMIDLSREIDRFLTESDAGDGLLTVFVPGSTAGVTTIEYESGALEDLKRTFERLVPTNIKYEHDKRWGDGNGFSHVRAALLGPSVSIPVRQGKLIIGTWQQVIVVDFDNRSRDRRIILQLMQ